MKVKQIGILLMVVLLLIVVGVVVFTLAKNTNAISWKVVNYSDQSPIEGVEVFVTQNGSGIKRGRLVWGQYYSSQTVTDHEGVFRATGLADDIVIIRVEKDGYIPTVGFYTPDEITTIKMKQVNPEYVALPSGVLQIGYQEEKPFGWVFAEQKTTFRQDEADIFPTNTEHGVLLKSTGGITFVSKNKIGVDQNMLVYTDTAPADGYSSSVVINTDSDAGVFFVKTKDEDYAKFSFDAQNYAVAGSDTTLEGNSWTLLLEYVFNPDGTRNVEYQSY